MKPASKELQGRNLCREAQESQAFMPGRMSIDPVQYQQIRERHQFAEKMRNALRDGEMRLYYQPKVNMSTGIVVGMEALIRWEHPVKGVLEPAEFLYLHDQEPLHIEIGNWVIKNAMKQIGQWIQSDNLHMPVSVNIEVCHLKISDFAERIAAILAEYPEISPQFLELEILESTSINNLHQVGKTIEECRNLGVSFALDDFGTGYSSLTYLKHLPINALKIDQAFVRDILNNKGDLAIVRAMISIADSFDLKVVAEGVETPEHGTMLMGLGCNVAQGYGISRPIPAEEIANWVREYKSYPDWQSSGQAHKDQQPLHEIWCLSDQT